MPHEDEKETRPKHRPIWKGALSFGLVNIPVKLSPAVARKGVRFHQLHDEDGARIRHRNVCSRDGATVPDEHIVKGFELGRGHYVRVLPDELHALDPAATRNIEIEEFVDPAEIDPIFYESTYYLVPDRGAAGAYALLLEAMAALHKVAVARLVMRARQRVSVVRPVGRALTLSTLDYADEIIPASEIEGLPGPEVRAGDRELAVAERLIEARSGHFQPERYHDTYREKVLDFVKQKAQGAALPAPPPTAEPAEPRDLLGALEASLEAEQHRRAA
jgi:DNA end-binding protein Ku